MEYTFEYSNLSERQLIVTEQEGLNRRMLHDDFTSNGGLLTFIDTIPLTAEESEELKEEKAIEKAEELIDAISNLIEAKAFLKRLCKRLFKSEALP